MLNPALAENDIELGANQVLEHCADIIGTAGVGLQLMGLREQVLNVRSERLACIEMKFRPLGCKVDSNFLNPPRQCFGKLHGGVLVQFIEAPDIRMHQAETTATCSTTFFSEHL
jgi:hypothetical protein